MDPKDCRTWTAYSDHPIFGLERDKIAEWSHDASRYNDLEHYGDWAPECYIHVNPPPGLESQIASAEEDIDDLRSCCVALEEAFGAIKYELVILDDFTVYVWVTGNGFAIEVYPNTLLETDDKFLIFVERPLRLEEVNCKSQRCVVTAIRCALEASA